MKTTTRNYQDIVQHFDTIEAVTTQHATVRVLGTKQGKVASMTVAYTHELVAREVATRVAYFKL